MDEALKQAGLRVTCAYAGCKTVGMVKPHTDYGGWYKSKFFRRLPRKRWYCPEHYEEGRKIDNKFYENHGTPNPYPKPVCENTEEELYKLLD